MNNTYFVEVSHHYGDVNIVETKSRLQRDPLAQRRIIAASVVVTCGMINSGIIPPPCMASLDGIDIDPSDTCCNT